jgi:hypothetical protein
MREFVSFFFYFLIKRVWGKKYIQNTAALLYRKAAQQSQIDPTRTRNVPLPFLFFLNRNPDRRRREPWGRERGHVNQFHKRVEWEAKMELDRYIYK